MKTLYIAIVVILLSIVIASANAYPFGYTLSVLPSPPPAMYQYTSKIFSIFQVVPEVVHPNDNATAYIMVTNNANFTLYDVILGESFNDSKYLALDDIHKIDTLGPNQTKRISGTLHVSSNVIPTDYHDIWWTVIAKNETGNIMESLEFHRNLTISQNSSQQCCDKSMTDNSPLEQFKSGIDIDDISCKQGLYLAIKSGNQEPVCLKAGSISKLAPRGFFYWVDSDKSKANYTTILIPPGSEDQASNNTYSPNVVTVVLGVNNTVRWVNQADVGNSLAADKSFEQGGKQFGSSSLRQGESYQFTFTEPGTFAYHGQPHPWQRGTIIVLPLPDSEDISSAKTYNGTNQVHYYDSSNLHPQVVLQDYFYNGIDKDGIVAINNQTFYQTTLGYDIYHLPKNIPIQFHNVIFSFPEGTLITPGGAFVTLDVKFQDGDEEIYGGTKTNPDGSGMGGGISVPTMYGPHMATNSTTVLGNHTLLQAGITIYNDKIKLLVSTRNQTSESTQLPVSLTSCDTPYLQSDTGVAVLYMPTNSIGKICVNYYNVNNTPTSVGERIFDANNMTNNASDITTWASKNTLQGSENTTIVYFIKTGNKTGFYGLSLTCGGVPLAVGYDANSTITTSDFPWVDQAFHCGVITYDYHIESTEGIGVRYIPDSSGVP